MIFRKREKSAEELLKVESGFIRQLRSHEKFIVSIIAIAWALFQLGLASFIILDSTHTRLA